MTVLSNSTVRNSLTQSLAEFSSSSVLIVSDKDILFRMVRDCLRDAGITQITVVANRQQASEKLSFESIDFIIIDLDIESNDAVDLISEVKNHKTLFKVPILALTGNAKKEFILKAARAGADDVIVKPFPLKQLRDRVATALTKQQ